MNDGINQWIAQWMKDNQSMTHDESMMCVDLFFYFFKGTLKLFFGGPSGGTIQGSV